MRNAPRALFLAIVAAAMPAWAQDPQPERVRITTDGQVLEADQGQSRVLDDGRRETVLSGRVELSLADQSVRADRAIAWSVDGGEGPPLRELYVEGNIRFLRRDPKTGRETVVRAERLYVDFAASRVVVLELKARTWSERLGTAIVANAREARSVARGEFEAEGITLTTCTFGDPDYKVTVARGRLKGEKARETSGPYDLWPYDEWTVRGEGITAELWGLPFFVFPALAVGSTLSDFPVRSVRGGRTTRFGTYVLTESGVKLRKGWLDALCPWEASGPEDDGKKVGDLLLELDWRQERGWATGLDLDWQWTTWGGYLDTYYLRDQGRNPDNDFDRKFPLLAREDRGRARLFHRHGIGDAWRIELEASYLSDRSLLEEFFEREFKEGKEQETTAYLRWISGRTAFTLQERHRINDFQDQTEMLPRARGWWLDEPLPIEGLSASAVADVGRLRFRHDEDDPSGQDHDTVRADGTGTLAYAIDLGPAAFSPFVSARAGAWSDDLAGESETRVLATAGARATAAVHGVHDVRWELVGIRRVRHILQLEARYANTFRSTLDAGSLFVYDDVDRLDRFEEAAVSIVNRFQTKVLDGERLVTREFLEIGAEMEFYPDAGRDTVFDNPNNVSPPFNWIPLPPKSPAGLFEERDRSNVHWWSRLNAGPFFALSIDGEYNPEARREEVREVALETRPFPDLRLTVGEIFARDVTDALTVSLRWKITERWAVDVSAQYDFEGDLFLRRRATLIRDLHDLLVEVVYEDDEGRDERKLYLTVVPKIGRRRRQGP